MGRNELVTLIASYFVLYQSTVEKVADFFDMTQEEILNILNNEIKYINDELYQMVKTQIYINKREELINQKLNNN